MARRLFGHFCNLHENFQHILLFLLPLSQLQRNIRVLCGKSINAFSCPNTVRRKVLPFQRNRLAVPANLFQVNDAEIAARVDAQRLPLPFEHKPEFPLASHDFFQKKRLLF